MSFSSSLSNKSNHTERTANILRQSERVTAVIRKISQETPTVKSFVLEPKKATKNIDFLPGQWLDVFIPNVSIIGGFSITSTPRHLQLTNTLDLAVKYSTHPPAKWFHEEATLGSVVDIRVGGEFYYDAQKEKENGTRRLLFIAGGVGINPLMSMLASVIEAKEISFQNEEPENNIEKIQLLYSARTLDELLFFGRIEQLTKKNCGSLSFDCFYFLTREDPPSSQSPRINEKFLIDLLIDDHDDKDKKDIKHLKSFLCGPTQMQKDVVGWLVNGVGLSENQVALENWE
ncbi:4489_t:CDS:2 [Ambispora gerdemannii]|uniref:Oxidoreductase NAD-binding domain-containing protein 1 n=1 Tax=Ambispora gerdemannii TaxID=144530 RepID=A0A9N8ZE05_9GLOM|nr:4489_t:CDS:2 [Ambispora gerdemannii]